MITFENLKRSDLKSSNLKKSLCLFSVLFAFSIGFFVGILIPIMCFKDASKNYTNTSKLNDVKQLPLRNNNQSVPTTKNNNVEEFQIKNVFLNNSFGFKHLNKSSKVIEDEFSTVSFVENPEEVNFNNLNFNKSNFNNLNLNFNNLNFNNSNFNKINFNNSNFNKFNFNNLNFNKFNFNNFVENGIFWSKKIEDLIPKGFNQDHHNSWKDFIEENQAVKLESGCGRMQNRLVIFKNGFKGCIRYRQNIDQIQGELFSFYLGQILKLNNLAPSLVTVVNLKDRFFKNIVRDISTAQWNSNKPIVLTKYIPNLDSANIPVVFKTNERHLNKVDVKNIVENSQDFDQLTNSLIELAQWCDLIIFDYLTANLDRVVNNLFNYQWNVNIMEAPAHNLAKNSNTNLLVFLDNESGLLHGYRLLQKYEKYHSILLDNLCMFRRQTVNVIKDLRRKNNVGTLLKEMFERNNDNKVKDVLPSLPEKSVKILNERIEKVYNQILKCESIYSDSVVR